MKHHLRITTIRLALFIALGVTTFSQSNTEQASKEESTIKASIAVEADAAAYALAGYSGIVNLSLRNGFQVAFGSGRYDVPSFLLKGDSNYEKAKWLCQSAESLVDGAAA